MTVFARKYAAGTVPIALSTFYHFVVFEFCSDSILNLNYSAPRGIGMPLVLVTVHTVSILILLSLMGCLLFHVLAMKVAKYPHYN